MSTFIALLCLFVDGSAALTSSTMGECRDNSRLNCRGNKIRGITTFAACVCKGGNFKYEENGVDLCASLVTFTAPETYTHQVKKFSMPNGAATAVTNKIKCREGEVSDPHIKTWLGKWYDWHGECDSVLIHAPDFGNGLGLDIHTRTKIRYDYSFIETAAIQIGDEILEVSSFGTYVLNGISQAALPATISQFLLTSKSASDKEFIFNIDIGNGDSIEIRTFKDIVSVDIVSNGPFGPEFNEWFTNSTGLMGSFTTGELLARDGVTVLEDPNAVGQEWQVLDSELKLFQLKDRPPQYPEKCRLPSLSIEESRRRLGESSVSRAAAEKACSQWNEDEREGCIYDVMATADLEMASAGRY